MSQLNVLRRSATAPTAFSGRNTLPQRTHRCHSRAVRVRAAPVHEREPAPGPSLTTAASPESASSSPAAACVEQALRLSATHTGSTATSFLLLAAAIGGLALLTPDAAHAADTVSSAATYHPVEIAQTAENDEFWSNVVRYIRYFFTVTSGGLYALASPFLNLFKKPTTAVVALVVAVGAVYVLKFTLDAMLGISEPFEYTPGSPVTYAASPAIGNF